ncbi:MAG: NUDIX domain-containing protein [Vicinamibacterales bacterium]
MPKKSAGLLLFRGWPESLEVLLVHPGGPFWARKDEGAWSIPKGEFGDDEEPLAAAIREFEEETGQSLSGPFTALDPVRQAGGKMVHAWAVRSDFDPSRLRSNIFQLEWPPRSGQHREYSEIDRAAWFEIDVARRKILKGQAPLLNQLQTVLRQTRG